jgi:hypothetical protein
MAGESGFTSDYQSLIGGSQTRVKKAKARDRHSAALHVMGAQLRVNGNAVFILPNSHFL